MKLHYFSGSTLPSHYANAVHVMKMCNAFAECGHDVTLLAKAGNETERDVFEYYDVPESFKLVRTSNSKIPGIPSALRALKANQIKNDADLIYGRDPWALSTVVNKTTSFVIELHEIPTTAMQKMAVRRMLDAKNLRGVVVITNGLKQALTKFAPNLKQSQILVAPDGADVPKNKIKPIALNQIADTDFQAGYAGSLYKGKGVELILEIAKATPNIGFHIFGGPQSELEKWRAQETPHNMNFYGHIPHNEVPGRLAACDVLLAPYMPKIHIGTGVDIGQWISPLKLFEYMAIKKPILCSDLEVLKEVMKHQENCLLANPENPLQWADMLEKMSKDKALVKKITDQAFKDLKEKYSWSVRAKNIIDFILVDKA